MKSLKMAAMVLAGLVLFIACGSTIPACAGVRADYVAKSKEAVIVPRLNLAYAWNDHMSVLFDYGWFYQSPKAYELGDNPDLKSQRAESYGIGIKHQVGDKVVVNLEAYTKKLARIVTIDSLSRFSNGGYGLARGARDPTIPAQRSSARHRSGIAERLQSAERGALHVERELHVTRKVYHLSIFAGAGV